MFCNLFIILFNLQSIIYNSENNALIFVLVNFWTAMKMILSLNKFLPLGFSGDIGVMSTHFKIPFFFLLIVLFILPVSKIQTKYSIIFFKLDHFVVQVSHDQLWGCQIITPNHTGVGVCLENLWALKLSNLAEIFWGHKILQSGQF